MSHLVIGIAIISGVAFVLIALVLDRLGATPRD
jgi:hypothetical protein